MPHIEIETPEYIYLPKSFLEAKGFKVPYAYDVDAVFDRVDFVYEGDTWNTVVYLDTDYMRFGAERVKYGTGEPGKRSEDWQCLAIDDEKPIREHALNLLRGCELEFIEEWMKGVEKGIERFRQHVWNLVTCRAGRKVIGE